MISLITGRQRLLGIDFGDKSIGLALSDTRCRIASAFKTIEGATQRKSASIIFEVVKEFKIAALVIGMPYHLNGSEGERCHKTKVFISLLLRIKDVPIVTWDERLSTKAAEFCLFEDDLSRKKRSKVIDKVAAAYILQGVLDYLHHNRQPHEPH